MKGKPNIYFEDKSFFANHVRILKKKRRHNDIRLPFCKDDLRMPNNRQMAEQRGLKAKINIRGKHINHFIGY